MTRHRGLTASRLVPGLLVLCLPVIAQASVVGSNPPDLASIIVTTMSAMNSAGASMAGKLVHTGEQLSAVLFALMFAWQVIQGIMAQRLDALMRNILSLSLTFAIVMLMLGSWGSNSGMGIRAFVVDGMNSLSATFAPSDADPTDRVIDQFGLAIGDCVTLMSRAVAYMPPFRLDDLAASMYGLGLVAIIAIVAGTCIYTLVIALAFSILYINQGAFIVYIGLAVGPVFVALLLFPPANGFFQRWVDFIISGGVLKLVSVLVSALLAALFGNLQTSGTQLLQLVTRQAIESGSFDITGFLAWCLEMLFWAFFSYQLVKEIPSFAHALSGGARGGITSLANILPGGIDTMLAGKGKESAAAASGATKAMAKNAATTAGGLAWRGLNQATGGFPQAARDYFRDKHVRESALDAARKSHDKSVLKDWAEDMVAREHAPGSHAQVQTELREQADKEATRNFRQQVSAMAGQIQQERERGERE